MGEARFAAALLLWGILPGFAFLTLAGVRWSAPERAAASAGLSLAVVAFAAYAAELLGLAVAPLTVAGVLAALAAAIFLVRRTAAPAAAAAVPEWPFETGRSLAWLPWLIFLAPLAVVSQLDAVSSTALLPPSLHDGLDHANWYRLIFETQSLNPREVAAPPLGPTGDPVSYPWGMHAWAALLARTSGMDPVVVFMRAMVATSAALPLSVYVFAAHFTGRGWTAIAAALFSLVFWWLPYQVWSWGGYALLAGAIAALPAARLALAAVEARHAASIVFAAAAMGGLLVIHPSQLFVALLATAVVSVTLAAAGLASRAAAVVFVLLALAAVAALAAGGMFLQPVADFLQRARDASNANALPPDRWPLGPLFASQPGPYRTGLAALSAIGAVAAALHARLRPLVMLYLAFGVLVLIAREQTSLTALWYHLPERIWYAQAASQPMLAAAGVGAMLALAARLARRWILLARWQLVIWPLALWAVFTPIHESYKTWADWRLYYAVHRNPNLAITERHAIADFRWMRANIPAGEVLFNAPADWGVALPFTGHRTVFWSGGHAFDPATPWHDWLMLMQRGDPYASHAGAELSARGVHYVYAARLDPAMERRGRLPLEAGKLRDAAAFTLLYESSTAAVLRADDIRSSLLGLHNSNRIRFEGFHQVEEAGRQRWRWSTGAARLLITLPEGDAGDCFVRVFGADPDKFELRHDGRELAFTPRGHRVPAGTVTRPVLALEMISPTFVPDPASGDTRALGVRVTGVGLSCQP